MGDRPASQVSDFAPEADGDTELVCERVDLEALTGGWVEHLERAGSSVRAARRNADSSPEPASRNSSQMHRSTNSSQGRPRSRSAAGFTYVRHHCMSSV